MKHLIAVLLTAFPLTSFAQLAQANQSLGEVKVTQILKATKEWDGSPLPPYPAKNPEITILRYEIPPGIRLPMHKQNQLRQGKMQTRDGIKIIQMQCNRITKAML